MSFIDLSDDDSAAETPKDNGDNHRQSLFSNQSMVDDTSSLLTMMSNEAHEEEQRRKREKLVKLHRFLGSRVPTDLALGLDLSQSHSLLPPEVPEMEEEDTRKKFRMRRRRSSSYAEYTKPLTTQEDRMKSELNIEEKALNVRRAAKMEKVCISRLLRVALADASSKGIWSRSTTNPLSHSKAGFPDLAEAHIIGGH